MSALNHWHKTDGQPSEFQPPAECCNSTFAKLLAQKLGEADQRHEARLTEKRKTLLLDAIKAITEYGTAAASVLNTDQAKLAAIITKEAVRAVKRTACICPMIDVSTFGGKGRQIPGRDWQCGMHDEDGDT